jgi:hypothetical protein
VTFNLSLLSEKQSGIQRLTLGALSAGCLYKPLPPVVQTSSKKKDCIPEEFRNE